MFELEHNPKTEQLFIRTALSPFPPFSSSFPSGPSSPGGPIRPMDSGAPGVPWFPGRPAGPGRLQTSWEEWTVKLRAFFDVGFIDWEVTAGSKQIINDHCRETPVRVYSVCVGCFWFTSVFKRRREREEGGRKGMTKVMS